MLSPTAVTKQTRRLSRLASVAAVAGVLALVVAARQFDLGTVVVSGGSMGETLSNGSLVVTRTVSRHDVNVGDVIVIEEDRGVRPKIHRVMSLTTGENGAISAVTRGDANLADDPVPAILSRQTQVSTVSVPLLGRLAVALDTPAVRAIAFTTLLLGLALGWRRDTAKEVAS